MDKAVNYLGRFWNQVFLYRKDRNYTIDNSLAERCIRPLANERKNSLFFGSDRMARVSAAYHSVVSTCRLQGYSILEYLKRFFTEIAAGNRNYGKLMSLTIGISANVFKNQPNFNLILDVPPEKQGVCQNWTLTKFTKELIQRFNLK